MEELTERQYQYFSQHLLEDTLFLIRDRDLMGWDQEGVRCVLVTSPERMDGILVNAEGYDYARYTAYIPMARQLFQNEQVESVDDAIEEDDLEEEPFQGMTM